MLPDAEKWLSLQAAAEAQLERALADPEAAQAAKLRAYLQRNANTSFGREHRFASLSDYRDYASAVPPRDYSDLEPWIMRIAAGEDKVLTHEPVSGIEETSGSSGVKKWIPFTASLRSEFEDAIGAWLRDLARHCPQAFGGRAYWSVSPPLKPRGKTSGGLPIGADSDLAYFSAESAALLGRLMAVPPEICGEADAERFWSASLGALLACRDLALISVWSPNFFLTLDQRLKEHIGRDDFVWSDLWPQLALMSCWTDAQSAMWMPALRERLGGVAVQGKGLLSTEGVVSVPLSTRSADPVLALSSHFMEFRERLTGQIVLAHELRPQVDYEVILTTGGGLYRYATGDIVRAKGDLSLRFMGRSGRCSDLVGEKLDEAQVAEALAGIAGARFLSAYHKAHGAGYRLFLGEEADLPQATVAVQNRLERNGYYRQAAELGQLRPLEVEILPDRNLDSLVEQLAIRQETKLGDVKVPALFRLGELEELAAHHG